MDVRLEFPGCPVVVSCADMEELRQVLDLVRSGNYQASNGETSSTAMTPSKGKVPYEDSVLWRLLKRLQGQKAAVVLQTIARSAEATATDDELRKALPEDVNLAPTFSHISKACSKESIKMDKLLLKKTRRGIKGKMHYRYTIIPHFAEMIRNFRDFDKLPDDPVDIEWDAATVEVS